MSKIYAKTLALFSDDNNKTQPNARAPSSAVATIMGVVGSTISIEPKISSPVENRIKKKKKLRTLSTVHFDRIPAVATQQSVVNDDQWTRKPNKVRSMAAQLFMGSFARLSKQNMICTSQPTLSCVSTLCTVGCDEKVVSSCASGQSCLYECDYAPDNDVSVAEDAVSDDEVFENIRFKNIADDNSLSSNSSEEDLKDAFKDFGETESSTKASKKKVTLQDFTTFVKDDKIKFEKADAKKVSRQKGDAESLKKYAYGKFICV